MAAKKTATREFIRQQERFHDELTAEKNRIKTKNYTYIAAIFTFFAFIYSSALNDSKPVQDRLFIPDELYGIIFYAAGLFFLMYALGKLIHGARPYGVWYVGYESEDAEAVETMSEDDYMVKLKNDNETAHERNIAQYNKHYIAVKDSFYPMVIGAIVLVVLRYFQ